MGTLKNDLLQGIDTIIIRVNNFEASKQWYLTILGLSILFEDADMGLAVLNTNSATSLTLWQTNEPVTINPDTASYPIFRTTDANALKQELLTRNVQTGEVIVDAHVTYFFFYDPDGNVLEACQVHE